ncbi:MAG: cytochrome P450 [Myxococcota bacterium]|nr:cytochrome P450 [Myxococcota bacterium]
MNDGQRPPGPKGGRFLGSLPAFRNDPLGFFMESTSTWGDVVHLKLGSKDTVLIRHPDDVRRVLQRNHKNYSKRTRGVKKLQRMLGRGLLTTDGDEWLRQRRISQPAFHRKRIQHFADVMVRDSLDLADTWEGRTDDEVVDIAEEMMLLTLKIASQTLFSTNVQEQADALSESMTFCMKTFNRSFSRAIDLPQWVPSPENLGMRRHRGRIDRIVRELITERRSGEGEHGDLLAMLIEARDEETGEALTEENLVDGVLTMLIAGHETTANALAWTWQLLGDNPEAEAKVRAEVDEVLEGRLATLEDLPRLTYTTMVIHEALRLRPPGWFFGRTAEADDELGGFPIPAGWLVIMSPYATHRHPEFWPEPERFLPERHSPEATEARRPFAYFPFSGGPRNCIGSNFAMMEMQLVVATLIQRVQLEPAWTGPIGEEPLVTLRPEGGVPMRIRKPA